MKKFKFILIACGLFIFFKNYTYAMEKTQYLKTTNPLETKEKSKNFSEYEIFEKTYEKWKSLSNMRHDFIKQIKRFNKKYNNFIVFDCSKMSALEIDKCLTRIEEIFLNIFNFFKQDFKYNFGKTLKNVQNYKYENEKYEQFKKSYDKYLAGYLKINRKTLDIYNKLMEIKIFNCLSNNYNNYKNMTYNERLQNYADWQNNIKNYLYPIYNIKKYKENEEERNIIMHSIPIYAFNCVLLLEKNCKENDKCFPVEILNGLKAVLITEHNKNIFYNNVFNIKEKDIKDNINTYIQFCESINTAIQRLDKIINNISKSAPQNNNEDFVNPLPFK